MTIRIQYTNTDIVILKSMSMSNISGKLRDNSSQDIDFPYPRFPPDDFGPDIVRIYQERGNRTISYHITIEFTLPGVVRTLIQQWFNILTRT